MHLYLLHFVKRSGDLTLSSADVLVKWSPVWKSIKEIIAKHAPEGTHVTESAVKETLHRHGEFSLDIGAPKRLVLKLKHLNLKDHHDPHFVSCLRITEHYDTVIQSQSSK